MEALICRHDWVNHQAVVIQPPAPLLAPEVGGLGWKVQPSDLFGSPGSQSPSLCALQVTLLTKTQVWLKKGLVMNIRTRISPSCLWSHLRNWGWRAKCSRRCSHCLYHLGKSKVWGALSQELWRPKYVFIINHSIVFYSVLYVGIISI